MSVLRPTYSLPCVTDIKISDLVSRGITCVLIDRDNTVVPRSTGVAPDEVISWLKSARAAGIATCIVSNNFHSSEVERSAQELGCLCVHHALKPAPFAVRRALRLCGAAPQQAVLIGDQVFTDVIAGNLSGTMTILVEPQSASDLWYTHILRVFERIAGIRHGK